MTADKFRDMIGVDLARQIAIQCGYSRAYWSAACTGGRAIAPERLACMTQALRSHRDTITAAIRAAEKELL